MATATRISDKLANPTPTAPAATPAAQRPSLSDRVSAWLGAHRQLSYWAGAIVVVAAALFVWNLSAKRRTEEAASRELQGARYAYENQNLPFAASELAKVIADYDGTNAAEQARLLLANVRLQQGQPNQAITVLKDYAGGASSAYRAQAYGLLGAAYENLGRFRDAGEAYENGSTAGRMDFQRAQGLADAGRAWTFAGDTAKAISAYRRIVKDFEKQPAAAEAKVRLGELTKGTAS
jgi:predicted negative regulator of RcsB-dependent stress response